MFTSDGSVSQPSNWNLKRTKSTPTSHYFDSPCIWLSLCFPCWKHSLWPVHYAVRANFRGCSQIMSAKIGWVQTPPTPLSANVSICTTPPISPCQVCQHISYPLSLNTIFFKEFLYFVEITIFFSISFVCQPLSDPPSILCHCSTLQYLNDQYAGG